MGLFLDNLSNTSDWMRIFNAVDAGLYITNANALTLAVNDEYLKMTGITADRLVGKYMEEIVQEGTLSTSITQQVIATGTEVVSEQTVLGGKHVMLRGIPIYHDGSIHMVVTIVRDATALKRIQGELEHSQKLAAQYKNRLDELEGNGTFVAESQEFRAAITLAQKVAAVDSTVLILGESGTGKEVLAREVHEKSPRHNQAFLKINCGAIPDNLLEAELFGYEGGAFTGAKKGGHVGLFEAASCGTLFLDEIGDMPLNLQVKLLRVLQEKTVNRIGSSKPVPINTRVIAATNQALEKMVHEKKFREDLYYRLNVVVIHAPALRERKSDIPGLINFFALKINEKYNLSKRISPELVGALIDYDWPGNVRELENVIERILVTSSSDVIELSEVHLPGMSVVRTAPFEITQPDVPLSLKDAFDRLERKMLLDAAKRYKTTYQIAKALQISQPSVSRKLKKYRETEGSL